MKDSPFAGFLFGTIALLILVIISIGHKYTKLQKKVESTTVVKFEKEREVGDLKLKYELSEKELRETKEQLQKSKESLTKLDIEVEELKKKLERIEAEKSEIFSELNILKEKQQAAEATVKTDLSANPNNI